MAARAKYISELNERMDALREARRAEIVAWSEARREAFTAEYAEYVAFIDAAEARP